MLLMHTYRRSARETPAADALAHSQEAERHRRRHKHNHACVSLSSSLLFMSHYSVRERERCCFPTSLTEKSLESGACGGGLEQGVPLSFPACLPASRHQLSQSSSLL